MSRSFERGFMFRKGSNFVQNISNFDYNYRPAQPYRIGDYNYGGILVFLRGKQIFFKAV
jgi:hypothetical protein